MKSALIPMEVEHIEVPQVEVGISASDSACLLLLQCANILLQLNRVEGCHFVDGPLTALLESWACPFMVFLGC